MPNKKYKKKQNKKSKKDNIMNVSPGTDLQIASPTRGKVHTFTQNIAPVRLPQSSVVDNTGAFTFTLNDVPQVTSFQALFDQYRIAEIQVTFRPMYTGTSIAVTVSNIIPQIYTAVDFDSATTTSIAAIREYSTCKTHELEDFAIRFKPGIAMAAYSGAFTSFANMTNQWLDLASPAIQHYGLLYGIEAGNSGQTALQVWNVEFQYKLEFRNYR